jgi:hypothetical protein
MKAILQHFAVETCQTKDNMTILLKLLIKHRPEPCYDSLPSTGKGLLPVSGEDVPKFKIPKVVDTDEETDYEMNRIAVGQNIEDQPRKKKRPLPMPKPVDFENGGKYIHYGLESALMGESPGLYSRDANIFQYATIYKNNPELVPDAIKSQVILNVIKY